MTHSDRATQAAPAGDPRGEEVRVDKWLWAARFFKTRSLAQTALENGRVLVDGARIKRSRTIQIGQRVFVRIGSIERTVVVRGVSGNRGSAPVAQLMYEETVESIASRQALHDKRKLFVDPAGAIAAGRPTKRDRRRIHELQGQPGQPGESADG